MILIIDKITALTNLKLDDYSKKQYSAVACNDIPENYTPTKTEQNQIPIYSNGVENGG